MGQSEDDIKIPFPVIHSILIRRECTSCIFWLVERQIRDKKLQLKCGWCGETTSWITPYNLYSRSDNAMRSWGREMHVEYWSLLPTFATIQASTSHVYFPDKFVSWHLSTSQWILIIMELKLDITKFNISDLSFSEADKDEEAKSWWRYWRRGKAWKQY